MKWVSVALLFLTFLITSADAQSPVGPSNNAVTVFPILMPQGTGSTPPLSLIGDTTTGFLGDGAGYFAFTSSGTIRWFTGGANIGSNTGGGFSIQYAAASATQPVFSPNSNSSSTGIGAQASGNMSMIVGGVEIGRFTSTGFTLESGQLNVAAMTQTATAQSGTVCYNSGTGAITYDATLGCLSSTERIKHDIRPLGSALSKVEELEPVKFFYNDEMKVPGEQIGLVAENVAQVDSRLVGYDAEGKPRGWSPSGMIAVLVQALKEQQAEIDELRRHRHD